jgi:hypothetical protein
VAAQNKSVGLNFWKQNNFLAGIVEFAWFRKLIGQEISWKANLKTSQKEYFAVG